MLGLDEMKLARIRRIGEIITLIVVIFIGTVSPTRADPPPASPTGTTQDPNRILPNTGWWYAKTESGRGYSVEAKVGTGTAFVATYVYDNNGKAIWYAGVLTAQQTSIISQGTYGPFNISTPLSGTLYAFSGGQTLGGAYKAPSGASLGTVTFTFLSPNAGTIDWPASITQKQTIIQRFPFPGSTVTAPAANTVPQSGWWYAPAESGRGYFLEVQGTSAFLAGYMYRADGTSVWFVAGPTTMTTPSTLSANLVEVANGPTFANPTVSHATTTTAGTVSASFDSPTTGTLILNGGTPIAVQRFSGF